MKNNQRKITNDRLGSYLTAALGISTLVGTADAAVVNLDIKSISGKNAGVTTGGFITVPFAELDAQGNLTGNFTIANFAGGMGFSSSDSAAFAVDNANPYTSPKNFATNNLIDSNQSFDSWYVLTYFSIGNVYPSPDFGADSFMGFKDASGHYGYLEVTWDSATKEFEILSGAYESEVGVGILAGATAVPEPASVLTAMSMLASGLLIRRRKQVA